MRRVTGPGYYEPWRIASCYIVITNVKYLTQIFHTPRPGPGPSCFQLGISHCWVRGEFGMNGLKYEMIPCPLFSPFILQDVTAHIQLSSSIHVQLKVLTFNIHMIHTDCTRNPCSAFLYNYSDHSCVKNKRYILNLILGEILTKQTKCPFTAHLNSSALHRGPWTVGCCWRVARAVDCCDPVSGLLLLLFGSAVIRNVSGAKRWAESTEHSRSRGALWSFVGASLSPGWAESVSMLEVLGRRWYHHHLSHNNGQPPIQLPGSIYYSSMHGIINQNMPILCPYRVR